MMMFPIASPVCNCPPEYGAEFTDKQYLGARSLCAVFEEVKIVIRISWPVFVPPHHEDRGLSGTWIPPLFGKLHPATHLESPCTHG